ncbi:MAG: NUDIX hydrolase [Henriciella sp.]|nr:NUDIX hydrolase [Henriciella sp.]
MIRPWKILSSQQTFRDDWLSIRSDRCQTAAGRIIEPFHVIEAQTWTNIVALTEGGDVVLIEEYRHGAGQVTLGVPGGVCDAEDGEFSVSAARELEEETGYLCDTLIETGRAFANWANQDNEIIYFLGFGAKPTGTVNLDPNEEIEVRLQPYSDFADYSFDGPKHTHHAAALFFAERYFNRHPDQRPK